MTALNLWLVFKVFGFVLWVMIFFIVGIVLFTLWEDMNGE